MDPWIHTFYYEPSFHYEIRITKQFVDVFFLEIRYGPEKREAIFFFFRQGRWGEEETTAITATMKRTTIATKTTMTPQKRRGATKKVLNGATSSISIFKIIEKHSENGLIFPALSSSQYCFCRGRCRRHCHQRRRRNRHHRRLCCRRRRCEAVDVSASYFCSCGAQPREVKIFRKQKSNCRKIARIAPISTIFGPNESSRRDLFLEKFSKERNKRTKFEKFEFVFKKFGKFFIKHVRIVFSTPSRRPRRSFLLHGSSNFGSRYFGWLGIATSGSSHKAGSVI